MNAYLRTVVHVTALGGVALALPAQPLPQHPPPEPVETVTVFFVQEVVGFQTEATETLAQDFTHYMSRRITPKPFLVLERTSLWSRLPPGPVHYDLIFPYTEPQGLIACLDHDLLPLMATSPNDRSAFQESVVIARKGTITHPRDLRGTRWCVGGRRPSLDFYITKHLLRCLLGTGELASIQLVHIYTNHAMLAEMRRDLIHYVLTGKADFAVVRRHELDVFARYYPRCAERLQVIPWLSLPPVSLETWSATPRARYPAMLKYRDELCRMHLDPEGEQYLMLVGFARVMPIEIDRFFALTNFLHLVESLDSFVWP
ncbi:MAG: hypothetical protein N2595_10035 [bacterium]|nr:hypothetical protein [bacterium]